MTRTDELTTKLLDGTLTDAEWAELEALLAADPAAEDDHLALLELEGQNFVGPFDHAVSCSYRREARLLCPSSKILRRPL